MADSFSMRIALHVCPTKFLYVRHKLSKSQLRILDVGCGNHSPSTTKRWFPECHYSGADIQEYNLNEEDKAALDAYYNLGPDGSDYQSIPDASFDLIVMHHVLEHMMNPLTTLAVICSKLKVGGYIWIAFPSLRSLSLPSGVGTLHFSDDTTHVYVPGLREVSNVLLSNGIRIVHAGRSRDMVRELLGVVLLPIAFLRKVISGKLPARGLWYILGFEDHVLGQRKG